MLLLRAWCNGSPSQEGLAHCVRVRSARRLALLFSYYGPATAVVAMLSSFPMGVCAMKATEAAGYGEDTCCVWALKALSRFPQNLVLRIVESSLKP